MLVALVGALCTVLAAPAAADLVTNANDNLRTGWYPDQGSITPGLVSGSSWGQLWSSPVDGQVYAQPLLSPTGTLIVTTENDNVYGLDPATGAQQWENSSLAPNGPWNPADVGCKDLVPWRGSSATPVIDTSTNTVYMTHKTYDDANHDHALWYMDALDISTGQELQGWPVLLSGTADNDPQLTFNAKDQDQRPGLLLMNGVVYAGFGSICDVFPFDGWVFGVSTSTHQVTARWASVTNGTGGGVWQAGVGLSSDGPGSILIATGNDGAPTAAAPGSSPPASCGECVIRLQVQSDGTLKPVDFFAPFDALQLDQYDADFGSGGVVGLPDQYFGTSSVPHLGLAVGKQGYVYLLNRDDLGGYEQGAGGGDAVVQRLGPFGGVWGRAGVWPGDGGYVYIPTSSGRSGGGELDVYKYGTDGSGNPSLSQVAHSSDVFGFGSGSPVITSDGTTSGSALVWIIWAANRAGQGGQLRAYDPVPVNGQPVLRWSASIGTASNYSTPGVGAGRLYVGTRDGHVLAFGSPVTQTLGGSGLSFPRTTIGTSSAPQTLTMTANRAVTISSLTSSNSQFSLGTPSQSLPATLSIGQKISVPVTFTPTGAGPIGGQLTASTDRGDVSFSLAGTGQPAPGQLAGNPAILSLGGTTVGGHLSGSVTYSNVGGQPLTVQDVQAPGAPFSISGAPAAGFTLAPGDSVTINVSFDPTTDGQFSDQVTLDTTDGESVPIGLSASAATPGFLQFSSEAVDFGAVSVGGNATRTFTITNTGGTTVTVNKSKPPFGGDFAANSSLQEGTTIAPGQTVTESVTFAPTSQGAQTGTWQITGDDSSGPHDVQFTGTTPGVLAADVGTVALGSVAVGGHLNGTATFTNRGGQPLTVDSVTGPSAPFAMTGAPAQGTTIAPGASVSVGVSFAPVVPGRFGDMVKLNTTDGESQAVSLSGITPGLLKLSTGATDLGTVPVGGTAARTFTVSNIGGQPLTVASITGPSAPFAITGAPAHGATIAPGASLSVGVSFAPAAPGRFGDTIGLNTTDGENQAVRLSGATPGLLSVSTGAVNFGTVAVGATVTRTFVLSNVGGTTLTIQQSTPPSGGAFTATTGLPAGTTLDPGQTLVESITFAPAKAGAKSATWQITGDDTSGPHQVQLTGTGVGKRPSISPGPPRFIPTVAATTKLGGIHISYTARYAGVRQFVLERATNGRRGAHGCVAATARNRSLPACTRYVVVARFTHHDKAGVNKLRLTAYVPARKLVPGTYRLQSSLPAPAGDGRTVNTSLRIVTPRRHHLAAVNAPMLAPLVDLLRRLTLGL